MKRDIELLRKIMLIMNGSGGELTDLQESLKIIDYTQEQVGYHCYLLYDSGLINAIEWIELGHKYQMYIPTSLTSSGHDFIDKAIDNNAWQATKQTLSKFKDITISLLIEKLLEKSLT